MHFSAFRFQLLKMANQFLKYNNAYNFEKALLMSEYLSFMAFFIIFVLKKTYLCTNSFKNFILAGLI
jgi:hypothetical protein